MNLYLAEMGNERFYIQPDRLELYANAGYTVYRLDEVEVTDVKAETLRIEALMESLKENGHD